jgi:hypothetical protein
VVLWVQPCRWRRYIAPTVITYKITHRHNPEDHHPYLQRRENLKSQPHISFIHTDLFCCECDYLSMSAKWNHHKYSWEIIAYCLCLFCRGYCKFSFKYSNRIQHLFPSTSSILNGLSYFIRDHTERNKNVETRCTYWKLTCTVLHSIKKIKS